MSTMFLWGLTLVSVLVQLCAGTSLTVTTELGMIIGTEIATRDKTPVYRFLGIPYAIPPVGKLRFQEPQPITKKYTNPVLAKYTHWCLQYLHKINLVTGEEDCLYLNIYTTSLSQQANFDVLVFIHGGGFVHGAGHWYTPEYLLIGNKKLVFVSINYRLGPFGFLSTDDTIVPGNNGLKDQVVALQWIQKNIEYFGGDPRKVVLAGMGAGAISVHLHYLSPLSRDLFSHGISMSGTALNIHFNPNSARQSRETLAKLARCPTGNSRTLVECLRERDGKTLMNELVFSQILPWNRYHMSANFDPVVEKTDHNPFLNQHPYYIMLEGKAKEAAWLVSASYEEGEITVATFANDYKKMKELDGDWEQVAPHLLHFYDVSTQEQQNEISQKIREYYFKDYAINKDNREKLVQMLGDRLYMADIENALRLHAAKNTAPVYLYMFDYHGMFSIRNEFHNAKNNLELTNADDLIYVLDLMEVEAMYVDYLMVDKMVEIWTNFIRNHTPSPKDKSSWPQVPRDILLSGKIKYMRINSETDIKEESSEDLGNRELWDNLPLNELHVSGDQKVPEYIEAQKNPYQVKSLRRYYSTILKLKGLH